MADPTERNDGVTVPGARLIVALAVGISIAALELVTLRGMWLTALPDYPAVILAFLITLVLPGVVVQRALLAGRLADPLVRLALAPALALAIVAIPGFIALEAHLDLQSFLNMFALAVGLACAIATYAAGGRGAQDQALIAESVPHQSLWTSVPLGILLAVMLAGIVTTPFWASGRVAGDFDDWTYMAYVREFLDTDELNASEPFIDSGDPVNPRMRSNVWVLVQAGVAHATDVSPEELLFEYLPPLLAVIGVLAAYALTRTMFGQVTAALLAALFLVGYALIDLAPHEGTGANLFLRISEDKMLGMFVLFPAGLVFLIRHAERPSTRSFLGFACVMLALMVVHPVPIAFLGAAVVSLAILRLAVSRSASEAGAIGLLLVPLVLASVWPLVQRELLIDDVPELWDSATRFRQEVHFHRIGGGFVIGNFHLFLHPLLIVSVLLAPAIWLTSKRRVGNQLVLALTAGAVVMFFTPVISTSIVKVMAPQTLWRVPWMIPVAPIVGYSVFLFVNRLTGSDPPSGVRAKLIASLALPVVVVSVLASALLIQEQYLRADDGAFYDNAGQTSLVPGTDGSIFLGGIDRIFSERWRVKPHDEELFEYLASSVPRGSVLLLDSPDLGLMLPGVLTDIFPVDPRNMFGDGQRRIDAIAFEEGELSTVDLRRVIDSYGVTHIVVREVGPATEVVRLSSRAEFVVEVSPYVIYEVR